MHYIFRIFRPLQKDDVCEHFRAHGIYVIAIDAFLPCETEPQAKNISLDNYLCNCNCNLARKIIRYIIFYVCNVLWTTVQDRQTPYRQRNVTPLVLFKEDQSCATFAWQYGDAAQMANEILETNLASRWEGVRLPRASGESPDFPGSFSATSPEVLSLWNLTAIQRFPRSFPNFPGSSPNFPGSSRTFPEVSPFLWEAWHPLPTHKNFLWKLDRHAKSEQDRATPPPSIRAKFGRLVIFPVLCLLAYGDPALKS